MIRFTFSGYEDLINLIAANGYSFTDYHNWRNESKSCILRHDVDYDLERAWRFSEFEAQLFDGRGVKSTYFVLLNTDFYNLYSARNRRLLERIQLCGHEIGLHFDEVQYDINRNWSKLVDRIYEEAYVLSKILGKEVTTVSMHRPSPELINANINLDGIVNSYSNEFFRDFKYVSDSRRHWREDVKAVVRSNQYDRLHVLTHAFWYDQQEFSMHDKLKGFICSANVQRYDLMSMNFRALNDELKREEVL